MEEMVKMLLSDKDIKYNKSIKFLVHTQKLKKTGSFMPQW